MIALQHLKHVLLGVIGAPTAHANEPYRELRLTYFDEKRREHTVERLAQWIERLGYQGHLALRPTTALWSSPPTLGNAARMSTEAALLARRGFISNDAIFESPRGYVSVLFDDRFDWDGFLADAGETFHLVNPGFNIKRYPAQIGMQPVINVMSDLRDKYNLKQEDVAKVEIELSRGH